MECLYILVQIALGNKDLDIDPPDTDWIGDYIKTAIRTSKALKESESKIQKPYSPSIVDLNRR
jgi:hypothetical protein